MHPYFPSCFPRHQFEHIDDRQAMFLRDEFKRHPWREEVISTRRTGYMTKGGRQYNFGAIMVVGNGHGKPAGHGDGVLEAHMDKLRDCSFVPRSSRRLV